jgi:hypothetical protein
MEKTAQPNNLGIVDSNITSRSRKIGISIYSLMKDIRSVGECR